MVGMSKSGSRYGRRSNWFKIHYLMQGNSNNNNSNNVINNSLNPNPSVTTSTDQSNSEHSASLSYTPSSPELSRSSSETKTLSPDFRDFKITQDFKLSPDFKMSPEFKLGSHLKAGLESKGLKSPTPSSSESHNSDSSLDLSERSLFSSYPETLYPKELLALYNIPTLAHHLPTYMSQTSLAHRYLYPFYPSLLSVYSRRQYLDSLLQKARQSKTSDSLKVQDEPCDLPSPNREFTTPTKFFEVNTIHPQYEMKVAVKSSRYFPVRGLLPLRHDLHGREIPSGYNKSNDLTSRRSPDMVSEGATAPQDLPIDLSVKNKPLSPQRLENDYESSLSSSSHDKEYEENIKANNKGEKEEERKKEEQEMPLDLSSVRMG